MGIFGSFECPDDRCDYLSSGLAFGPGMVSERELRSCAACGGLTSVLTVRPGPDGSEPASGRGRCPECGSQRLRRLGARTVSPSQGDAAAHQAPADHEPADPSLPDDESTGDDPACPRCGTPLVLVGFGMWD